MTWAELPTVDPAELTVRTVPAAACRARGPWAGLDDQAGSVLPALGLWAADLDRGLGAVLPTRLPRRCRASRPWVQPSKRRTDRAEEDHLRPRPSAMPPNGTPGRSRSRRRSPRCLPRRCPSVPDGDYLYEPKWDGFRSIIFRSGDRVEIGSRNEKPMTRYFPEIVTAALASLPAAVRRRRRDRPGPPRRRPARLRAAPAAHPPRRKPGQAARRETPASFVAFDLLALGDEDLTGCSSPVAPPAARGRPSPMPHLPSIHPATTDRAAAQRWFKQLRAPAWTASSPSRSPAPTSRTSGRWSGQARPHR